MKVNSGFHWTLRRNEECRLRDCKVAIFGGTGGLGREIGLLLASLGSDVLVIGQNFKDNGKSNISFVKADLSSIKTSKALASEIPAESLDVVLFTAGIFASPSREETAEGLERDLATSYLNRLEIIDNIAPRMKKERNLLGFKPRIFLMGYPGSGELGTIDDLNQEQSYGFMKAHMNTVAGNEALVIANAEKYPHVNFFGLNPGIVKTNIRNNLLGEDSWKSYVVEGIIGIFTQTPDSYASSIVPLLLASEIEQKSGSLFDNKGREIFASEGMSKIYAEKYLRVSRELLTSKITGV
ncbi:related to putative short-chain dehydrogenase/reductase [Zygosaccharomyces bailii]|nr:related to putative short-chain dehydrogenase/reductase [Zygosaccharomyces bailii]